MFKTTKSVKFWLLRSNLVEIWLSKGQNFGFLYLKVQNWPEFGHFKLKNLVFGVQEHEICQNLVVKGQNQSKLGFSVF